MCFCASFFVEEDEKEVFESKNKGLTESKKEALTVEMSTYKANI